MTEQQHHAAEVTEAAINELKSHQRQLDADGVEVGVSRQALDEVLAALRARPAAPEGEWVVVPRIPDREMIEAGLAARNRPGSYLIEIWDDMLAAAPKPEPASAVTEDMVERAVGAFGGVQNTNWRVRVQMRRALESVLTTPKTEAVKGEDALIEFILSDDEFDAALAEGERRASAALSQSHPAPQPDAKASGVEGEEADRAAVLRGEASWGEFRSLYPTPPTETGVEEPEVVAWQYRIRQKTAGGWSDWTWGRAVDMRNSVDWDYEERALICLSDHNTIGEQG